MPISLPTRMDTVYSPYINPITNNIPLVGIGTPNGTQQFTESVLKEMKDCGLNVAQNILSNDNAILNSLDAAKKTDFKILVRLPLTNLSSSDSISWIYPTSSHWDGLYESWKNAVNKYGQRKEIAGWFIGDEPTLRDFWFYSQCKITIQKVFKTNNWSDCPSILTTLLGDSIYPDRLAGGLNSVSSDEISGLNKIRNYNDYYTHFYNLFKPSVNNFDIYPCRPEIKGSEDQTGQNATEIIYFFNTLTYFLTIRKKTGIPFWSTVQTCQESDLFLAPSKNTIQYQAFIALAFGAQGLSFWRFSDDSLHSLAPLDKNGNRTSTFFELKEVLKDISYHAGYFIDTTDVEPYVTNIPNHNPEKRQKFEGLNILSFDSTSGELKTPLAFVKNIKVKSDTAGFVVSKLTYSSGTNAIVVVNMDMEKSQRIRLDFSKYVRDVSAVPSGISSVEPNSTSLSKDNLNDPKIGDLIVGKINYYLGDVEPGGWKIFIE